MSVATGGASIGSLSESIVGKEMPAYRYVKTVDLPTYDVDHFLFTLLTRQMVVIKQGGNYRLYIKDLISFSCLQL